MRPGLRTPAMALPELPLVTSFTASSGQAYKIGRDFVFILLMKKDENADAQIGERASQKLERERGGLCL